MESSTEALLRFERELNVINPEEKTSILSARLLQLNTEYTNAQADRVRKEAEIHAISGPSDEAVLTSPQGDPLRKLVEHQNDLKEKFAQVSAQFGVNHPEYRKMATQIAEVQQQIDRLHANIPERVGIEFGQSRNRESMLSKVVAETKKEFDDLNARSFEYQQLKREAEADKKLYEELVRKIKEAGINASFQNSSIRLADFARPSVKPVFPDLKLNTLLALLFASFLGIGAAVLSDVLDNTVRDGEEMSRSLNVPVVGTLPCVKSWSKRTPDVVVASDAEAPAPIVLDQHATSAFTESIRTLRNNILLADFDRRLRTILVSSPLPSEGKSTIAAHLAVAHAQQGKKTLLVDADLRRPSIHRRFGFTATAGLSSVLLGEVQWAQVLFKPENVPDLDILPAGPPSRRASDLVGSNVADLLEEMSQEYDLVIVDTPPLLGFAEALRISTAVDGVLIVARAGQTNRQAVGSTISTLQRLRVHVVGLVLNEVKRDSGDSYYYHGYYNRYYKADQE